MTSRACPVCDHNEAEPYHFSDGPWQVVCCTACGMVYLRNPPKQESLKDEFAWVHTKPRTNAKRREGRKAYYLVSNTLRRIKRLVRWGARKEVTILRRFKPDGGRLIDVGCSRGTTLKHLAEAGRWEQYGIEPSPQLAAIANTVCQPTGGRVVEAIAVDGFKDFEDNFFDAVMLRSYLEHEAHVMPVLREVYRTLEPAGCAVIKVPNAACWNAKLRRGGWPGVRHPDHVNYFRPVDLKRAVDNAGFEFVHCPFPWRSPTSDSLWMMIGKAQHGQ